jgi:hypothetical protein
MHAPERLRNEKGGMGYVLLWLIGIPIPVLVLLYLFFH